MVSNEKWFEPLSKTIDMLKLKGSYGKVGNDDVRGQSFQIRCIPCSLRQNKYLEKHTSHDQPSLGSYGKVGNDDIGGQRRWVYESTSPTRIPAPP